MNIIAPGAIETDFGGGEVRDNAEVNRHIAAQTALGRVGLPDDIGDAIAALLSDELAWMNAQRVEVSGGCSSDPDCPQPVTGGALRRIALPTQPTEQPVVVPASVEPVVFPQLSLQPEAGFEQ